MPPRFPDPPNVMTTAGGRRTAIGFAALFVIPMAFPVTASPVREPASVPRLIGVFEVGIALVLVITGITLSTGPTGGRSLHRAGELSNLSGARERASHSARRISLDRRPGPMEWVASRACVARGY